MNSPSRTGKSRMPMKPTEDAARRRAGGSETPRGRSRYFQRVARK
jgi:hypothetical protein